MRKYFVCFLFVIFSLSLNGCKVPQDRSLTLATETPNVALATNTRKPQLPSASQPLATNTISPSPTVIKAIPLLEMDEAYTFLQKKFRDTKCHLPCWLGVTPGISSIADAKINMGPLVSLSSSGRVYTYKEERYLGIGGSRKLLDDKENTISITIDGYSRENEDNIQILRIITRVSKQESDGMYASVYGNEFYNQLFEQYNLQKILSVLGPPSKILVFGELYKKGFNRQNDDILHIRLFYSQKGVFIHYEVPIKRLSDSKGQACPSNALISLWLTPSDQNKFYEEYWAQSEGLDPKFGALPDFGDSKSVDEGTYTTLAEFLQVYTESNQECLGIPLAIWPQN